MLMKDLVMESKYTSDHKREPDANRRQEQHCPEGIQDCENPRPQISHQLTIPTIPMPPIHQIQIIQIITCNSRSFSIQSVCT